MPFPLLAALFLTAMAVTAQAADHEVVRLWPDKPADSSSEVWIERAKEGPTDRSVGDVSDPTLTVYLPESGKTPGPAILVCPGGGYGHLAIDKEGYEIGRWLSSIGVAAFVLKYRLPFRDREKRPEGAREAMATREGAVKTLHVAVEDAEKAMGLIRAGAKKWNIRPDAVGMMGFSAGGHLTALEAMSPDKTSHPDFVALIYGATPEKFEFPLGAPPAFLAAASDDPTVNPQHSIRYYLATKEAGAPVEMHLFLNGGHGFGLKKPELPVSDWPNRFETWLKAVKFLD